jgi:hypothetical protein
MGKDRQETREKDFYGPNRDQSFLDREKGSSNLRPHFFQLKINFFTGGVTQVVEHLPSRSEALSSIPRNTHTHKKK